MIFFTNEGVEYTCLGLRFRFCYVTRFAWNRQSCIRAYNWCAELVFIGPCVCAPLLHQVSFVCVCNKQRVDAQTGMTGSCTRPQQQCVATFESAAFRYQSSPRLFTLWSCWSLLYRIRVLVWTNCLQVDIKITHNKSSLYAYSDYTLGSVLQLQTRIESGSNNWLTCVRTISSCKSYTFVYVCKFMQS